MADEDFDTIETYWAVLAEMRKSPGTPDPKDGAATLRALAQQEVREQQ